MSYKYAGFFFTALLLGSSLSATAEMPFTNLSTGYDWNSASSEYRLEYCNERQESILVLNPEVTPQTLKEAITEYYSSSDPAVLQTTISQLIASILTPASVDQ